jgi:Immunity protein Imm1
MSRLLVTLLANEAPTSVGVSADLESVFAKGEQLARRLSRLGIITLQSETGDTLHLVVGGAETALGFTKGDGTPPYFASRGSEVAQEPVLTGFLHFAHHTELPRHSVVSSALGRRAAHEFLETRALPKCIQWQEV